MNDHHDGDTRLTEQVVASFGRTPGPRLCVLMQSVAWQFHAFILDRS
ncbi:hypothetical protein [Burkholderia sp. GS2Y]|uniref:Uncharacterized protein n=1 Tax=Burkholderia theae TaxID=3143496 RepID=A0ABU9WAD5_9BURK